MITYRCNYCPKPATVYLQYKGHIQRGYKIERPTITVAACDEHRECPNFAANRRHHPESVLHGIYQVSP